MNRRPSTRFSVEKIEEREQEDELDRLGDIHLHVRVSAASILSIRRDSEKLWYGRGFNLLPRVEDGLNSSIIFAFVVFLCFCFLSFVNMIESEELICLRFNFCFVLEVLRKYVFDF